MGGAALQTFTLLLLSIYNCYIMTCRLWGADTQSDLSCTYLHMFTLEYSAIFIGYTMRPCPRIQLGKRKNFKSGQFFLSQKIRKCSVTYAKTIFSFILFSLLTNFSFEVRETWDFFEKKILTIYCILKQIESKRVPDSEPLMTTGNGHQIAKALFTFLGTSAS